MHVGVEMFSCIFLLYTHLLTLSKHKGENVPNKAQQVSVIARSQDGWILAEFSYSVFMDRDEVEVYKNVTKEGGQYPAILTELAWSIKDLLPPQGFGPEAKTRGGILGFPACIHIRNFKM